ncbi:MAG: hypothetical protein ACM3JG_01435, partial [Thiohalocapsa sp.]
MRSAEELRLEARQLRETASKLTAPELKKELAARALALSERAEAIANSRGHRQRLIENIARYRRMLTIGIEDATQQLLVRDMLADAEELLSAAQAGVETGR